MVREMLSDITVARWMQCVTNDMLRNNRTDIRCLCRRCKLECVTELDSGILERHLKCNGLMDGYTRWISDEAGDQEEDVNGGAPGNEEGQPDEDQDVDMKTKMSDMKIKIPDMRIKIPDMRIKMPNMRI